MLNWESLLLGAIPGLIALIGLIYQEYRKRKNARDDAEQTASAKKEPTWNEVVNENRQLRTDLTEQKREHDEKIESLEKRFSNFERKTNRRIGALSNIIHATASQWPANVPGPVFPKEDLEALEDTDIPYVWRNRVGPAVKIIDPNG